MSEGGEYNTTVKEAMEILGKSRRTIYRKIKSGEIDAKKVTTDQTAKWMIKEDDLYQNKMIQESVDIEEVERRMPKEELFRELKDLLGNEETLKEHTELLHEILEEIRAENKQLRKEKNQLLRDYNELQKANQKLRDKNEQLQQKIQELKKKSLTDRVRDLFN